MRRSAALAAALAAIAAPAAGQAAPPLVASFDSTWAVIHRTHYDTAFNGVDWEGARRELRPRVMAAGTPAEARQVINQLLGRLRESHFYLIPRETERALAAAPRGDGDAGMQVRLVEGALTVTSVRTGGPAARAGIQAGWTVEWIADRDGAAVIAALTAISDPRQREMQAARAMQGALSGAAGDPVELRLRDGAGRARVTRVLLDTPPGEITRFGNLPPLRAAVEHHRLRRGDETIGVIRFNLWLPVLSPRLDRAVDELRDVDGIILDLRGNPGGAGAMAMGFAGHFVSRRDTLGTMRMRGGTLQFVVNPRLSTASGERVRPFEGPLAILTDAGTASTSEIFAGGMQRLGRARVFGAASAGQALPAWMKSLPSGDVLVHAVADYTGPGGSRFEGTGVLPDVPVTLTRAALLAGDDPVLEAAAAWIRTARQ